MAGIEAQTEGPIITELGALRVQVTECENELTNLTSRLGSVLTPESPCEPCGAEAAKPQASSNVCAELQGYCRRLMALKNAMVVLSERLEC